MSLRVLVTGATGFIGRAVARELHGRVELSALVRGAHPETRLARAGIAARAVSGRLEDSQVLRAAVRDIDVVVHLAASVDPVLQRDTEAVLRVNRDTTLELSRIARESGVRRFVFMSSIAAMGFWSGVATSESRCRPALPYGRAKLEAEHALSGMTTPDFDVVVIRPPTVYGPGEAYNFLEWVRSVDRGLFHVIGSGDNAFPLATSANVARATRAAVDGRLQTGVYLVADSEPYPMKRIHRAIARALGKTPSRWHLPRPLASATGFLNEAASTVSPRIPLMLTPMRVRTLTVDQRFDVSPLLRAGVELDAPLEEWVELTVRDYEKRGALRRPTIFRSFPRRDS